MELTGPRWKGKCSAAIALSDPMSNIVLQLQTSLLQSESTVILSGCNVILEAGPEQVELLNRACFGHPIVTAEKDKQWFQLVFEESFYMFHELRCIVILGEDKHPKNIEEIWEYMKSKRKIFPDLYKAYSHLRRKNWVVRSGSQYGVDFVVYRHHPALVHSEYAVLVLSEGDDGANDRLRVWSDLHCSLRLCGSVAKTLLVLTIKKNGERLASSSYLEQYSIEERTIARWRPEQCRDDQMVVRTRNKDH
ncbi:tRNA-splicing endonuclease subunit Sen2-1-like [Magnolia sinica]|uniref:tRNA-splicing endonuclease subunit Sen2-1-like n=1 Tax=Magnolia sinica TaxID=86752 RepID=UPI0026594DD2|nr:tRNA-splicing endonuclease subunit Sen2-1-like [Magnolia sinica]XP_058086231.1 tRNA-splicing endonuclease subunit Sen2-1-like [Magnolia sinica]XP_058086232.1 tRNA-splicing endonuclease subunit Sen2-1-like [Magnolia sinica]